MNWCSSLALHLFFFFFWLLLYFFWFYFFVRTCSSSFSLQYDTGSNSLLVLYYLFKLNSVVLIAIGVLYVMSVNVMIAIWCRTKDMIYPRQVLTNMEMVVIYLNVTSTLMYCLNGQHKHVKMYQVAIRHIWNINTVFVLPISAEIVCFLPKYSRQ